MFCTNCGQERAENDNFCSKCGTKKSNAATTVEASSPKQIVPGTPKKLWQTILDGEWGLLKTFVVFGVVIFFAFGALRTVTQEFDEQITFIYFLFAAYSLFAAILVGRAVNNYTGSKIWKILVFVYTFVILLMQPVGFLMNLIGI